MNDRGSVLVATLGLVLIFLLFGLASIHHAGEQNLDADRRQSSVEAFWIAEAGLEVARSKLGESPVDIIAPDKVCMVDKSHVNYPNCGDTDSFSQMDNGEFHVYSEPVVAGSTDNWRIESQGNVITYNPNGTENNEFRGIRAKFGSYDIEDIFTSHGTINKLPSDPSLCTESGSAQIIPFPDGCAPEAEFTFETVFNGLSYADFITMAIAGGQNFTLTNTSDLFTIDNVTVLHMVGNTVNKVTINETQGGTVKNGFYDGAPAFLIVDTSGYTGVPTPGLDIGGGFDFCGIIWIIGGAKIAGNPDIKGAIFIDESPPSNTIFSGDSDAIFDISCVSGAISSFGGTGPPKYYDWHEYSKGDVW